MLVDTDRLTILYCCQSAVLSDPTLCAVLCPVRSVSLVSANSAN